MILKEVFNERTIYSNDKLDADQLSYLLTRLHLENESRDFLHKAERISQVVTNIEQHLNNSYDYFLNNQSGAIHQKDDLLWQKTAGFGWAEEDAKIAEDSNVNVHLRLRGKTSLVGTSFYINLRIASTVRPELQQGLEQLKEIVK